MTSGIRNSIDGLLETLRFCRPYMRVDDARLALLCLLNIVTTGGGAVLIWMLGRAVSEIAGARFDALYQTLLVIGAVVLLIQSVRLIYSRVFQAVTFGFVDRLRGAVLAHIMRVSFPILRRYDKGDLLSRLGSDVDAVLTFVVSVPLQLFSNVIVLVVYASLVFWIDWRLATIALVLSPLFFLSQRFVAPRTGEAARNFTTERARLVSVEEQALSHLREISAFNAETAIRARHQQQYDTASRWALRLRRIRMSYNAFATVLVYLAGVVVVFSGVASIESGRLSIGVLVSFLIYLRLMIQPVRGIARIPAQLEASRGAAERVMEVMHTPSNVRDRDGATELQVTHGNIAFDQVSFAYAADQPPVMRDLTLTIDSGETVALVGPSGSGKSTFAGLLLRFFDPQQGTLSIDGVDLRHVTLTSLRRQVSIVWQNPFILDGSIRANLLLAKPDATDAQLQAACAMSYCAEFIDRLAHGLDTVIGHGGTTLSVGQVQRLAIAQAFLRDTPILILDEASSALDSHSEQMVVNALAALREGRTTLIIAHRFSSIRAASRILYFNGDGTVTSGTHEELIHRHPNYRSTVEWQTSLPSR